MTGERTERDAVVPRDPRSIIPTVVALVVVALLVSGTALVRAYFTDQQLQRQEVVAAGDRRDRNTLAADVTTLRNQLRSEGITPDAPPASETVTGERGDDGQAGLRGPPGRDGTDGRDGGDGGDGATGLAGANGVDGGTGPGGETGTEGAAGADGTPGASVVGPAGATGPAGPAGQTGAQGPAGAQGVPGATGPAGETGPAGTDGTSPAMFTITVKNDTYTCAPSEADPAVYECVEAASPSR